MSTGVQRRLTHTLPLLAAGVVLLIIAIALLVVGGSVSISHPAQFDFYLLLTGILVVLGSIFLTLVWAPAPQPAVPAPAPAPDPSRSPPVAGPSADPPFPEPGSVRPMKNPVATPPPAVTVRLPALIGSSSIAGQLSNVTPPDRRTTPAVGPDAQRLAASLPFFPLIDAEEELPFEGPALSRWQQSETALAIEVDRLRARIQELESPSATMGPATRGPVRPSSPALEPPGPGVALVLGGRACVGCGTALKGGPTEPLCWGCGRPLCANCYWTERSGPLAHRCPTCLATGVRPTTLSGGRAGAIGPVPPGTPPAGPPAGPRVAAR